MAEAAHTPGPWSLIEVEGKLCPAGEGGLSILTTVDEDGTKFAAVYEPADAHLIAAAPEMLEALKVVAGSDNWRCFVDGEWDIVNAAIDKAEGHTP